MTSAIIFSPKSTLVKIMLPTVGVLFILAISMATFSYWQTKTMYEGLLEERLTNLTQTSRNVIASNIPQKTALTAELLDRALAQTSLTNGTGIFIFSKNGKLLYNKGSGNVSDLQEHMSYFYRFGDSTHHALINDKDESIVAMHMPSRDLFIVTYSQNTFASTIQSHNLKRLIWFVFPIATMAAILFLFIVLKINLLNPLVNLTHTMKKTVAKGRFDKAIKLKGSLEIQQLLKQFNIMLLELSERDKALKHYSNHLKSQVAERTKELTQAQDKLVLNERLAAIGEFASSIVHELRNPLSAIKMGVDQLVLSETNNEKNSRRLTLAQQEITRLDEMLSGVLTFAATRPTQLDNFSTDALLRRIEDMLDTCSEERNIKINYQGFSKPFMVRADKNKLQQALLNIIKNACDAAPDNSDIEVKVSKKLDNVHIGVTNQGEPIPKDVHSRIFEPFFTTKKGGTGLGLPTTKKLITEMHGDLIITSNKKTGTTATIIIPKSQG